jgi:amino acid adenylation domain-containing protein
MLADAGSRLVLTADDLPGALDPTTAAERAEPVAVAPDDLAYALFTSGSTGRPKGALVEHRGMLNHMLAKAADLGLDENTVLAQNASQCFDISIWQLFGALVVGGRTVVCPDEVAADPRALLATVRAEGVTTLEVVPSLLDVTLDLPVTTPLAGLSHLLVTGEAVPVPLLARWFHLFPTVPVVNAYGPTEASDDITHHILRAAPDGTSVPIGRPIPNARLYVVDDTVALDSPTALSPRGVVGELCVAGPCVGRGYVGDEERTAAAFPPDPFVGGRLYRTGDLGRWLPDGTLEFLGRKDDQVKVRGHRIELGEVEAALARCPGVGASAAAVRDDLLVGYVVTAEPADTVKAHLGAELPAYMVPDAVVVLDRLPLTGNGKIDRKALPAPTVTTEPSAEAVPPATELEWAVAALFTEVLGIETTDAAADFFALGGQSLKAVLLLALAQERFGVLVPLAEVFRDPTVRGVAAAITRRASMDDHPVTRLGPPRDEAVFAFPPIAGWGLVYLPLAEALAEALPDHAVHAFDFLLDEHRVKRYADLVEEHQPAGELTLLGYSAGGNLAFEVAVELESRGRGVRTLVMYDALYRDERTEESPEHVATRVRADMAEGMQALDARLRRALSTDALQSLAATRRAAYVSYWQSLRHETTVSADITLVRAKDTDLDEPAVAAWRRATTGRVTVLDGSGRHAEMMSHPHAAANARAVRRR